MVELVEFTPWMEKVFGREHPDTLASMNNLALVLRRQEKYEEAEQVYWRTLKLKEKVLGREHPSTIGSRKNLGRCLIMKGKGRVA